MSTTNLKPSRTSNTYILIYYCIVQRNFTHLIRCQTMKVKPYIVLNTSRKHVNYEEVPMNKPYNIQNTNICNGIFHISFFKALLINEGETTHGANGIRGEATRIPVVCSVEIERGCCQCTLPNLRFCGHWVLSSFSPLV